ncbi:MAG: hypothetical protein CMO26_07560 [Thiotrichales bacterium]|nr:hypothetical protein [Thiotrichales bacterium]|tara:strand:- start:1040 stop:1516 length:477 start_codon:yes stop_codon:yes gene_type:complete
MVALLGNIIWLILGGWVLFILYALGACLFFPIFVPIFRIARFAVWPFGRTTVTSGRIEKYKEITGKVETADYAGSVTTGTSSIINFLWMCTFGWILALTHLLCAVLNLCVIWLIVTIPNIGGHWKMMPVAFRPLNRTIVPQAVADEINNTVAKAKLGI